MAKYLNNKDLYTEICTSLDKGDLTPKAEKMLILLSERAVQKLKYRNPQDREDCISFAQLDLFKYWNRFKPEKSNNPFAFYTQIAKNGYAKGWNKLHPEKYKGTISLSGSNSEDSDEIYSI